VAGFAIRTRFAGHPSRSAKTRYALRLKPDHSIGAGQADVLNPDIAGAGGILAMLEIGALAHAHGAQISPHSWNSTTVAFMAMLHVCAVMRNATYAELYYDYLELGAEFAECDYVIADGYVRLPHKPGLGVEMQEEVLVSLAP
jgi:L-alanine-DL-glutamate epimerase-like enolase superfamily enzyme